MAKITVIGGSGYAGGHVVAEAAERGHTVTSISRNLPEHKRSGVNYVAGDIRHAGILRQSVHGSDIVVCALAPRGDMLGQVTTAVAALAHEATAAGVRLGIVGGAGSLFVSPDGPKLMDTPAFPAEAKAESAEMGEVLDQLKATDESLDWFLISPAGGFGSFAPGTRTGMFRVGGDILLIDEDGNSNISGQDLAVAIVDEIETPTHRRQRFTVAY